MKKFKMFKTLKKLKIKNSFQISNSRPPGFARQSGQVKFQIAILVLVAILLFANTTAVQAQVISLSLWPPLLEVQMMPGKTVAQAYRLTNNSDSFLSVTPMIFPFTPQGEKGEITIKFPNNPQPTLTTRHFDFAQCRPTTHNSSSLPSFFSFASGEQLDQPFSLKPLETRQLILKITLPKAPPQRDYYFTLLFSTVIKDEVGEKSKTASIAQIGTNILLTSSNEENPFLLGRIRNFSSPKIIDSFSEVQFNVTLENFGKTFWKPFGKIQIEGILKQKGQIDLLPQNVLAGSQRQLDLAPFKPGLPIGPFKAKLIFSLNSEEAEPKLSSEIVFWYLPYKLLIVIVFVGVVLALRKLVTIQTS